MKAPTVPPMSPETRERIRQHLIEQAKPHYRRPRRGLPVIAAVTTVAGVVAVGGHVLSPDPVDDPDSPAATTSTTPSTTPSTTVAPGVVMLDRGAPSAAHVATVKQWCLHPEPAAGATVEFARRVLWSGDGMERTITAVVLRTGPGKYRACFYNVSHHRINRPWRTPSRDDPVRRIAPSGTAYILQVHPSIARLETRVRWPSKGVTTPWMRAVIANGVAYTANVGPTPPDPGTPVHDIRAFDAAGQPIPLRPGS